MIDDCARGWRRKGVPTRAGIRTLEQPHVSGVYDIRIAWVCRQGSYEIAPSANAELIPALSTVSAFEGAWSIRSRENVVAVRRVNRQTVDDGVAQSRVELGPGRTAIDSSQDATATSAGVCDVRQSLASQCIGSERVGNIFDRG